MEDIKTTAIVQIQKDLLTAQIILECLVDELIDSNAVNKEKFAKRLDEKLLIIGDMLKKIQQNDVETDVLLKSPMASYKVGEA